MAWWLAHSPALTIRASRDAGVHRFRVELRVPLPELEDRSLAVGQRGNGQERLVLPDRRVLDDLLVDLGDERVGDRRRELLVGHLPHDEAEADLRGLLVD